VNTLGSSAGTNQLGEGVIFGAEAVIEGIAVPNQDEHIIHITSKK